MSVPYTTLVASTTKKFEKGFVDQIIKDNFLLSALMGKDLAVSVFKREQRNGDDQFADGLKLEDGGEKIFVPIMYARNATVSGYADYDVLDITHAERFTAAEYSWKSIAGSINLAYEDLDKNSGSKEKIFDLMEGQLKNLGASIQEKTNEYLIRPKTSASGAEAKLPLGLMDIIPDDPTADPTVGSIGGISVTGNDWWQSQMTNHASGVFGTDPSGSGQTNLRALLRNTQFGTKRPHVVLAGTIAYDRLERSMVNQIRYNDPKAQGVINAGFMAFMFHGVPVVLEKEIDVQRTAASLTGSAFYALNLDFLKLYGMKQRFFKFSSEKEPVNQDTIVVHNIARLQLCCSGRRYQGVMKAVIEA